MQSKVLNVEFIAKKEGSRFRVPSKFDEIDIHCEILYSFAPHPISDNTGLYKSYYAPVKKKRYVTLPPTIIANTEYVYILIHQVRYPTHIEINRAIKQRITSRGQIKLPTSLGLGEGDLIKAQLNENLTQDIKFHSQDFENSVTKEGYLRLPLSVDEFSAKDRFEITISEVVQLPANHRRFVYADDGRLEWICVLQSDQDYEITYYSDPDLETQWSTKVLNQLHSIGQSYINITEIDDYFIPVLRHKPSSTTPSTIHCILVLIPSPKSFPIFSYLDLISDYYKAALQILDHKGWKGPILQSKYQDFSSYLLTETEVQQNIDTLPRFLPSDLVDRAKYDEDEAAILSIMVSKSIDQEEQVTVDDLELLLDIDEIRTKIQLLVQRGILVERRDDLENTAYSFPRFTIPSLLEQVHQDDSLVLIVHSFGGGVAKTTFSCNFSTLLGTLGLQTILIDFDFINSRLETIFTNQEAKDKSYLNQYLIQETPIDSIIRSTKWPHLDVILTDPAGDIFAIKTPNQETNLKYFTKLTALIRQLRTQYDFIIFDAEGSIDYNIINAFLLSDISFILSNGNETSLKGLVNRSKLILKRTGINIRNDYLIQTLVPQSKLEIAQIRADDWKQRFENWGIHVISSPLIDEELVREYIYENQYFLPEDTAFYKWMKELLLVVPRLLNWTKLQNKI